MSRTLKASVGTAALLAFVTAAGMAGSTEAEPPGHTHELTASDVDAWLDGYLPYALAKGDIAGAAVVVVKDGQVLTQRGYGYADLAARRRVDPATTLFRPGIAAGAAGSSDIDASTRARVIDAAIAKLNEFYVFPDVAKKMGTAVRARAKRGEYDAVTDGNAFANLLTEHFRDVSHDKHLSVTFSPIRLPEESPSPSPDAVARYRAAMQNANCGFEKVEHLSGNIGYLKFDFFADPEVCGGTAIAAMNFLANTDAVIFDLRQNGGGDPKMVALLCTYLFAQQTHLNDLWERKSGETHQYWTLPYVPGKRLPTVPVFVLTSHQTFSGGEEFSNNLKVLKRATIVGEATGGGAHPVAAHRIDDHFTIGVPFARAINPITKTNWEGVGVEPDVKVPASDALTTAQTLASTEMKRSLDTK